MSEKISEKRKWRLSRRGFLVGLGATGGLLALGVALGRESVHQIFAGDPSSSEPPPGANPASSPDAWFEITADDQVRIYVAKVEMGQGIHTTLAQIAAEELEARWDQIEVVQASTANGPGDALGTQASASITGSWLPLRTAAASMREMLVGAMATRLNTAPANLKASEGAVHLVGDPQTKLSYGEIVALTETWPEPPDAPTLKPRADYLLIGSSMPRVDIPQKVMGNGGYSYDVDLDEMLYGAVAHPPAIGVTIEAVERNGADEMPGVIELVIDQRNNFVGAVADTRSRAWKAINRMNITWSEPEPISNETLMAQLDPDGGRFQMQEIGNAPSVIGSAPTFEAEYRSGMAVHATMEPQASTALVIGDQATIWTGTQFQEATQTEIAQRLRIPADAVEIIPTYLGGGFGRKLVVESSIEAALLSQAVGQPVQVGWQRTDMMQQGFYRPPTVNRLKAKLDGEQITAIDVLHSSGETFIQLLPFVARLAMGVDSGSYTGAASVYDRIENRRLTPNIVNLPIRTGLWRGLGLNGNIFAMESFMDELAEQVGVDPVQFRLNHLGESDLNRRLAHVLQRVADLSEWSTPAPAGRARGIALCADAGTCTAVVAEVGQDEAGFRVYKLTTVVDAGLIINPDGATAQIQGCMLMGTSSALYEDIVVEEGRVTQRNFDTYPILRFDRAPEVMVELVDSPDDPRGLGEFAIGPVAAAIANGVSTLTGVRQRQLPFKRLGNAFLL